MKLVDMSKDCVVPECRADAKKKKSNIVFFPVPSDKRMLEKWQGAIPGTVVLAKGQKICSKHFRKSDIMHIKAMKRNKSYIKSMLSKNAVPRIFPDPAKFDVEEVEETSLYDELTLIPEANYIETTLRRGEIYSVKTRRKIVASNFLREDENSGQITVNDDSVCHIPLHASESETIKCGDKLCTSTETFMLPSTDMSDSDTDCSDIKEELSISDLRESIQNDLKQYVMCRKDLDQILEQNMDLQTNSCAPQFTFDNLYKGAITIQLPTSWYKVIPQINEKVVVFANFVSRTDKRDQMLVSYKSICIGEDEIPKCSILDTSVNIYSSECIKSTEQLESIITRFDKLLVCKGVILEKEFAFLYSRTCYIDKRGHWRHMGCTIFTTVGYETCCACKRVKSLLLKIKDKKRPSRDS